MMVVLGDQQVIGNTLDLSKPIQTRSGKPAKVLRMPDGKLVGYVQHAEGDCEATMWHGDGYNIGHRGDLDLINVPEKRTVWANINSNGLELFSGVLYGTKEIADKHSIPSRIACVKIEFAEGQGLNG